VKSQPYERLERDFLNSRSEIFPIQWISPSSTVDALFIILPHHSLPSLSVSAVEEYFPPFSVMSSVRFPFLFSAVLADFRLLPTVYQTNKS
jgi:hypothetical protein